jgi:hypothetical protein
MCGYIDKFLDLLNAHAVLHALSGAVKNIKMKYILLADTAAC